VKKTWVIKIGSQLIIEEGPLLINSLAKDVARLKKQGIDVVWVTSGAIATAKQQLGRSWKSLPEKQALSALGQPLLMQIYNTAFAFHEVKCAQVLLTASDFKNQKCKANLKNTLRTLLKWGVVPIINENDTVATDEIQFGDNDQLSSLVACELKADRLVILTNVDGLYTEHPDHPDSVLLHQVLSIPAKLMQNLKKSALSSMGRGGMYSKVTAALQAQKAKVSTSIIRGNIPGVLLKLRQGDDVGTTFLVGRKAPRS
jgi:glutamate 5-kinase